MSTPDTSSAAPAPAPEAPPATPTTAAVTEPQVATAPVTDTDDEPALPKLSDVAKKTSTKAEILNRLRKPAPAQKPEAKAEGKADDKPEGEPKPEPKKDEQKPDRAVQTIAKLNTEIRGLKEQLAKFEANKAPTVEDKAAFIAKVKADPSILFKEIDDPELLSKLAEIKYRDLTPEEKVKAELDAKIEAINNKLAETEKAKAEAEAKAVEQQVYGGFAQILTNGLKGEDGKTVIDHSRWALCQKVTSAGEADAPRMAMSIATELAKDLGRKPTEAETQQILEIAFDQLEGAFRRKADVYRLDPPKTEPTKTNTVQERPRDQRPRTITSKVGSAGRSVTTAKPQSKAEQKAAILARVRATASA